MRKVIAAISIVALLAETPSCRGAEGGGSGNPNHPNVVPAESAKGKQKNQRPYPTKAAKSRHTVKYVVGVNPTRRITVTWTLNSPQKGNIFVTESPGWTHTEYDVPSGSYATLKVENHGKGGYTECVIYLNGILIVPGEGENWSPYEFRNNDAGDCEVDLVVP